MIKLYWFWICWHNSLRFYIPCLKNFVRVAICCPWFSKMSRSLLRSSNAAAFWCGPNIYILQMGPASVGSNWWLTNINEWISGYSLWYPYDTLFSDKPSWVASWYTSDSKLPKWCQNHPNTIIRNHPKPSLNDAKIMPHADKAGPATLKAVLVPNWVWRHPTCKSEAERTTWHVM